jgi:ankyrin repeat domain-containing protein 50
LRGENEVEVEKISSEIDLLTRYRVDEICEKHLLEPSERDFLREQFKAVPNRTYIWVVLTLDVVENIQGFTKGNVRNAVGILPQTINQAYNRILERSLDKEKAKKLLHIITAAKRPLTVNEISVAMALDERHKSWDDVEEDLEPANRFEKTVRDLCGLFIVIVHKKLYLLHQTAKEFLVQNDSNYTSVDWKYCLHRQISDRILAERCIWYLTMRQLTGLPGSTHLRDFKIYAKDFWDAHLRDAVVCKDEALTSLAGSLCNIEGPGELIIVLRSQREILESFVQPSDYRSPLLIASILHLPAVVELLLGREKDLKGHSVRVSLTCAAALGHQAVLSVLLAHGTGVHWEISIGVTPLSAAVSMGHEAIVRLLLDHGANVHSKDRDGRSQVWIAADHGHVAILELLLDHGADVNSIGRFNRTPLIQTVCANNANAESVRLLLERGANIDSQDSSGCTTLLVAFGTGQMKIAELLLDRGANTALKTKKGTTPLHYAARKENMIRLLLDRGADADPKDNDGVTPLMTVAGRGNENDIMLLLDRGADAESQDKYGNTPLAWAVRVKNKKAVRLLLEKGADVNSKNNDGRTPLMWVVPKRGSEELKRENEKTEEVIKLLLDRGAEVDSKDKKGRTLLSLAAEQGSVITVNLLLDQAADINSMDTSGYTPLSWATEAGKEEVIKLLLDRGAEVDSRDKKGRTPLSLAAKQGSVIIVNLLLDRAADINSMDTSGYTPLSWATEAGKEEVIRLLVDRGAKVDIKEMTATSQH